MQTHKTEHSVPWQNLPKTGRLLRMAEVIGRTGLSRSQIYRMMADGEFPPLLKLSPGTSAMPEAWLDAFIAAKAGEALSEPRDGRVASCQN